jgi:uncharacterized protein (DUF427 family)
MNLRAALLKRQMTKTGCSCHYKFYKGTKEYHIEIEGRSKDEFVIIYSIPQTNLRDVVYKGKIDNEIYLDNLIKNLP